MKKGFTLIELLVASLLLGLLVSILTTIFSQSSIAWSTGTAGVVDLDETRRDMAALQASADMLIDKNGLSIQSVFKGMTGADLNNRAYAENAASTVAGSIRIDDPSTWSGISVGGAQSTTGQGAVGDGKGYVFNSLTREKTIKDVGLEGVENINYLSSDPASPGPRRRRTKSQTRFGPTKTSSTRASPREAM